MTRSFRSAKLMKALKTPRFSEEEHHGINGQTPARARSNETAKSFRKNIFLLTGSGIALLSACSHEAAQAYQADGTYKGKPAYAVTTSIELGSTTNYEEARMEMLVAKASNICPKGFTQLGRTEPMSRTSDDHFPMDGAMVDNQMGFSDVVYRIACN